MLREVASKSLMEQLLHLKLLFRNGLQPGIAACVGVSSCRDLRDEPLVARVGLA
jgi:hypothetical protein